MREIIVTALREIEILDDIKVLYACESGSRAWGFESADSDWDVRFIYVRNWDRYLSLTGQDDTIDHFTGLRLEATGAFILDLEETHGVDIAGWDLKKTLKLMAGGNPALSEWFYSPIVYISRSPYAEILRSRSRLFYKNKAGIFHYEHMARRNFDKYVRIEGDEVITKKYLYILRPLFAMAWLDVKGTPPPMRLKEILDNMDVTDRIPGALYKYALELIDRKKAGEELGTGLRNEKVDWCIEDQLDRFRKLGNEMMLGDREGKELSDLDSLYYDMVTEINADWENL